MKLTTLLLNLIGLTPLSKVLPLQSMLDLAGFSTPRLSKVQKLVLNVRILIPTRGADRVLLMMTQLPRRRTNVVSLPTGPAIFNMPEER